MIEYSLSRSKRKTLAIYIKNGAVEVRAPLKSSNADIDRFVLSKEKWIKDKLTTQCEQRKQKENFSLSYGDTVFYRGCEYLICAHDGSSAGFDGERFYLPPNLTSEQVKLTCTQIYRLLAKRYITYRVNFFAERMNVSPAAVKINGAKTRWGSCSVKKRLNFSYLLIMADDDVIDYVVVHELAHIIEMNHSVRFWAIVEDTLPHYKKQKIKLKALHEKLAAEAWEL